MEAINYSRPKAENNNFLDIVADFGADFNGVYDSYTAFKRASDSQKL